jgi:hypothetical protein
VDAMMIVRNANRTSTRDNGQVIKANRCGDIVSATWNCVWILPSTDVAAEYTCVSKRIKAITLIYSFQCPNLLVLLRIFPRYK